MFSTSVVYQNTPLCKQQVMLWKWALEFKFSLELIFQFLILRSHNFLSDGALPCFTTVLSVRDKNHNIESKLKEKIRKTCEVQEKLRTCNRASIHVLYFYLGLSRFTYQTASCVRGLKTDHVSRQSSLKRTSFLCQ